MKQIIALGGGGFSMESSPVLDDYILEATGKADARVCFLPTASGDSDNYLMRFYRAFLSKECEPSHLDLFRRSGRDLAKQLLSQDVIYVGGGNTANMLAVWKLHGVDEILRQCWESGVVLAGVSAGAVCWFEMGSTDSFGPGLSALGALGFLPGSMCPHYDGEAQRRPRLGELIKAAEMPPGYAADDSVALHFRDQELYRVVSSRKHAKAYYVNLGASGEVVESELETEFIGDSANAQRD
jgi:dipeptidase E